MFLSKEEKDSASRMYHNAEAMIVSKDSTITGEAKANILSRAQKGKLMRSMNRFEKFGAVCYQNYLTDGVFVSKKQKQRYLDWLYKMAVKHKLEVLISSKVISPHEVIRLRFFVDEHTTATNGRYELKESIEHEFRDGIIQYDYNRYVPPLLPCLKEVTLQYCDSKTNTLIRASDIIANSLYNAACDLNAFCYSNKNMQIIEHPISKAIRLF